MKTQILICTCEKPDKYHNPTYFQHNDRYVIIDGIIYNDSKTYKNIDEFFNKWRNSIESAKNHQYQIIEMSPQYIKHFIKKLHNTFIVHKNTIEDYKQKIKKEQTKIESYKFQQSKRIAAQQIPLLEYSIKCAKNEQKICKTGMEKLIKSCYK
jgi:hypothetical protein